MLMIRTVGFNPKVRDDFEAELVTVYRELAGKNAGDVTDAYHDAAGNQMERLKEFDKLVKKQVEERAKRPPTLQADIEDMRRRLREHDKEMEEAEREKLRAQQELEDEMNNSRETEEGGD